MPKYVIEREMPGVGNATAHELHAASQTSCAALKQMGPHVQWVQSFVTDDRLYCIYVAPDENAIREHARLGGFPANKIARIRTTIDPTTAE